MKTIIAGSRDLEIYKNHYPVWVVATAVMECPFRFDISEVVCGGARGIDIAGKLWAESVGFPVKDMLPDYKTHHPKVAPKIRNQQMADYADALILIWNGTSRGSADMLERAKKRNLKIFEYITK